MSISFLIDECLSPDLVALAHEAGYHATSLRDRGWTGLKDHEVVRRAFENDFTLVTRNAKDFRGSGATGGGGLLRNAQVHAGLVCVDSKAGGAFDIEKQESLFGACLDYLDGREELLNVVIEVVEEPDGALSITEYELP